MKKVYILMAILMIPLVLTGCDGDPVALEMSQYYLFENQITDVWEPSPAPNGLAYAPRDIQGNESKKYIGPERGQYVQTGDYPYFAGDLWSYGYFQELPGMVYGDARVAIPNPTEYYPFVTVGQAMFVFTQLQSQQNKTELHDWLIANAEDTALQATISDYNYKALQSNGFYIAVVNSTGKTYDESFKYDLYSVIISTEPIGFNVTYGKLDVESSSNSCRLGIVYSVSAGLTGGTSSFQSFSLGAGDFKDSTNNPDWFNDTNNPANSDLPPIRINSNIPNHEGNAYLVYYSQQMKTTDDCHSADGYTQYPAGTIIFRCEETGNIDESGVDVPAYSGFDYSGSNPLEGDFWSNLFNDFGVGLGETVNTILDGLYDMFIGGSSNEWDFTEIEGLDIIYSRIPFLESSVNLITDWFDTLTEPQEQVTRPELFKFELYGEEYSVFDYDFYEEYRDHVDWVLIAFAYLSTAWALIINIKKLF